MADDWRTQDVEAMFDGDPGPRIARRGGALLPRPLHARRAARHVPALGRRPPARRRHALRARSRARPEPAPRRSPGSRRGSTTARAAIARCSTGSPATVARPARPPTPPARRGVRERLRLADPQQGPAGRADARAPPRRRARVRGARSEPRGARPELRPRHPVRAHERHHRVRRRRRRRPRHHRRSTCCARPAPSCRGSATLGYGRCRLAAAVPNDAPVRRSIEDLAGLRVATAHPNTARRFFAERGIPVEVIPISGAVEVAPRLGLAEAIVDLVSTGSTLVDERPAADRRRARVEAVLVANPNARPRARPAELAAIDTMLGAVIAARGRKYLMMNAPAATLAGARGTAAGARSRRRSSRSRTRG